ncbi:MAG: hypothetical protein NZ891_03435 [bacterium]|nr:hypothetical protein [bacterium]MDW8163776.1 hypothetical protein [Candidatus Omnitrophota bacterium]
MRWTKFIFLLVVLNTVFGRESIILKRNIFTAPLPPPPTPKTEPTNILKPPPLPSLETIIEITGIIYFPQGNSFAIIKDKKTNNENIYKEEEKVGESKIIKILKDKVIFEYDGKNISLNLENKSTNTPLVISKEETSKVVISSPKVENPNFPEEVISMNVDFNKTVNSLINDQKLIENLNLLPNVKEGRVEGFKISNLPENSLLYQYGLRNGDIIRRVNGILIDSVATGLKVYTQIKNSNTDIVTIEVLRENRPILLTYRLRR